MARQLLAVLREFPRRPGHPGQGLEAAGPEGLSPLELQQMLSTLQRMEDKEAEIRWGRSL